MNPAYKNKINGKTTVLDINSLYPSIMYTRALPYGDPVYFEGEYQEDKIYNLYIQCIRCSFKLKQGKIPTIQIKHSHFIDTEYLENSNGEEVVLTLTNIDLKLFLEQYDTEVDGEKGVEYIDGWKFKSMESKFFKEYIDKWIAVKNEGTITGNKGQRTRAKLMLNSLYGKFATSQDLQSKIPYLREDGIVGYKMSDKTQKDGIYIPMGCFITSYAREVTQRTSQAIKTYSLEKYGKDLYCYSDTDSIHTLLDIEELKQFCDIDDVRLGAWKHEGTFPHSKFVRQKTYVEVDDDNLVHITCAGMPKNCVYKKDNKINTFMNSEGTEGQVEFKENNNKLYYKDIEGNEKEFKLKDFKEGFSCGGKLNFKHVRGGVILVETDFTVKGDKKK